MYDADALYQKLMTTIRSQYPNFQTFRIVISGASGSGKSVAAASFPVPKGKIRRVMDGEDSMAFIDAGLDGKDVYTPRKQRFAMKRTVYPTIRDYAALYKEITSENNMVC